MDRSTDSTPEICRRLGCEVYHFLWPDSFAAARNESLKYARGQWIFWMDSDDVIDAENGRKLAELVQRPWPENILGFVMQVHCPPALPESDQDATVVDHCKLFRNRRGICFDGRVHEQVMESINRLKGDVAFTDIYVVHAGADHSPEGYRRKLFRDIRLLHLDRRERPNHPFVHFNFGMTYADCGKHRKAIKSLRRSLELAQPGESHLRKVYALLVVSHRALGQVDEATRACEEGLKLYPKDPELLFRHGMLLHDQGRLRQAEQAYLGAIANTEARHFASRDRGMTGYKARQNLAVVYNAMGALHKAQEQWEQITREAPLYGDAWEALAEIMLLQGKAAEAHEVAKRLLAEQPRLAGTSVKIAAQVVQAMGNTGLARDMLQAGVRECPADPVPLAALCQWLFYFGRPQEAEAALAELARRRPQDAFALHNLGTMLLRLGRNQEAIEAFRASLRFRPDAPLTQLSLGYAFNNAGMRQEAAEAFRKCLRQAAGEPLAAEAQRQLAALAA